MQNGYWIERGDNIFIHNKTFNMLQELEYYDCVHREVLIPKLFTYSKMVLDFRILIGRICL